MAIHFQINPDKTVNENGYRSFVKNQMATQPFQKATADDIVTKCIEELKKPEPVNSPDEAPTSVCSKNAMRAFKCAAKGIFNSCPTDLQDNTDECSKLRDMINNGKMKKHDGEPSDGRDDK